MTTLGMHSLHSFLRNLPNNNASSIIKVSIVCFFPLFILGIFTLDSKWQFNFCIKFLVLILFRYSRLLFFFLDKSSNFVIKSLLLTSWLYCIMKSSIRWRYISWKSQTKLGLPNWTECTKPKEEKKEKEIVKPEKKEDKKRYIVLRDRPRQFLKIVKKKEEWTDFLRNKN